MATTFGGNATTNFNLPNLQGRAPVGTGVLNGVNYTLAASGGSPATTLSLANLPPHNHAATFVPTMNQQVITIPATSGTMGVTASVALNTDPATSTTPAPAVTSGQTVYPANAAAIAGTNNLLKGLYTGTAPTAGTNQATIPVSTTISGSPGTPAASATISTVVGGAVGIGITGSGAPFDNRQPFLAMSFVIAVNGLYPDRP